MLQPLALMVFARGSGGRSRTRARGAL